MRKIVLVFLSIATALNFVILAIALTNQSSFLYNYRLAIGISFMMFSGFLRQHILRYNKTSKK